MKEINLKDVCKIAQRDSLEMNYGEEEIIDYSEHEENTYSKEDLYFRIIQSLSQLRSF